MNTGDIGTEWVRSLELVGSLTEIELLLQEMHVGGEKGTVTTSFKTTLSQRTFGTLLVADVPVRR